MKLNIFDIDSWREIMLTLSRNKTRTFLTAFGIFWGTAILTICWGGGRGFQGMMRRNFQGLSTNLGYVACERTTKDYQGFNKGRYWYMTDLDIERIRENVDQLQYSTTFSFVSSTLSQGSKSSGARIIGVEPAFFNIMTIKLLDGRALNENDQRFTRKVALIGKNLAGQLFGKESPVGQHVQADGIFYQIVGVASQLGEASIGGRVDESLYVPASVLGAAYNNSGRHWMLGFTTKSGTTPSDVIPQMRRILFRAHYIAPDDLEALDHTDASEMFEMIDNVFTGVDLMMLFVGLGTLLAGVIGVGNIMWIIVKERTQEIGIRRAIGARPAEIMVQILSESTVLTTLAGLTGIALAAIILGVTDKALYDPWHGAPGFEISFAHALAILVLFLVLGTAAGIIPALRTLRIKPVEALNTK